MAIAEATLGNFAADKTAGVTDILGRRAGLLGSIFGCWHRVLTRPVTRDGETYRACVKCGARRLFNLRTWELNGPYYYRASSSSNLGHAEIKAVQPKRRPWLVRKSA